MFGCLENKISQCTLQGCYFSGQQHQSVEVLKRYHQNDLKMFFPESVKAFQLTYLAYKSSFTDLFRIGYWDMSVRSSSVDQLY